MFLMTPDHVMKDVTFLSLWKFQNSGEPAPTIPQSCFMGFKASVLRGFLACWEREWAAWLTPEPFAAHKDPRPHFRGSAFCIEQYALGVALRTYLRAYKMNPSKAVMWFGREIILIPADEKLLKRSGGGSGNNNSISGNNNNNNSNNNSSSSSSNSGGGGGGGYGHSHHSVGPSVSSFNGAVPCADDDETNPYQTSSSFYFGSLNSFVCRCCYCKGKCAHSGLYSVTSAAAVFGGCGDDGRYCWNNNNNNNNNDCFVSGYDGMMSGTQVINILDGQCLNSYKFLPTSPSPGGNQQWNSPYSLRRIKYISLKEPPKQSLSPRSQQQQQQQQQQKQSQLASPSAPPQMTSSRRHPQQPLEQTPPPPPPPSPSKRTQLVAQKSPLSSMLSPPVDRMIVSPPTITAVVASAAAAVHTHTTTTTNGASATISNENNSGSGSSVATRSSSNGYDEDVEDDVIGFSDVRTRTPLKSKGRRKMAAKTPLGGDDEDSSDDDDNDVSNNDVSGSDGAKEKLTDSSGSFSSFPPLLTTTGVITTGANTGTQPALPLMQSGVTYPSSSPYVLDQLLKNFIPIDKFFGFYHYYHHNKDHALAWWRNYC